MWPRRQPGLLHHSQLCFRPGSLPTHRLSQPTIRHLFLWPQSCLLGSIHRLLRHHRLLRRRSSCSPIQVPPSWLPFLALMYILIGGGGGLLALSEGLRRRGANKGSPNSPKVSWPLRCRLHRRRSVGRPSSIYRDIGMKRERRTPATGRGILAFFRGLIRRR
jgi:hypothetical protein